MSVRWRSKLETVFIYMLDVRYAAAKYWGPTLAAMVKALELCQHWQHWSIGHVGINPSIHAAINFLTAMEQVRGFSYWTKHDFSKYDFQNSYRWQPLQCPFASPFKTNKHMCYSYAHIPTRLAGRAHGWAPMMCTLDKYVETVIT